MQFAESLVLENIADGLQNKRYTMKSFLEKCYTIGVITLLLVFQACAHEGIMKKELVGDKKILIIVTNHSDYPTRTDKTGLWVTELTHFYDVMIAAGFDIDIASPLGGKTPLDERSLGGLYLDQNAKKHLKDPAFMAKLNNTFAVASVKAEDYIAIYFTGGHGTMWDFKNNADLARTAETIYNQGGYISSVCHGAAALLNIKLPNGQPLIAGKKITGFSNNEEWLAGLKKEVPYFLEDELIAQGANYQKALFPFTSYALRDGRVVTGQNPYSGKAVAKELLAGMKENK